MNRATYIKDPQAILDWVFDWSQWLAVAETITARTITVDAGITKDSDTATSTAVTVWLSGGTDGVAYQVACRITTSSARTDERTITIRVQQR